MADMVAGMVADMEVDMMEDMVATEFFLSQTFLSRSFNTPAWTSSKLCEFIYT